MFVIKKAFIRIERSVCVHAKNILNWLEMYKKLLILVCKMGNIYEMKYGNRYVIWLWEKNVNIKCVFCCLRYKMSKWKMVSNKFWRGSYGQLTFKPLHLISSVIDKRYSLKFKFFRLLVWHQSFKIKFTSNCRRKQKF